MSAKLGRISRALCLSGTHELLSAFLPCMAIGVSSLPLRVSKCQSIPHSIAIIEIQYPPLTCFSLTLLLRDISRKICFALPYWQQSFLGAQNVAVSVQIPLPPRNPRLRLLLLVVSFLPFYGLAGFTVPPRAYKYFSCLVESPIAQLRAINCLMSVGVARLHLTSIPGPRFRHIVSPSLHSWSSWISSNPFNITFSL